MAKKAVDPHRRCRFEAERYQWLYLILRQIETEAGEASANAQRRQFQVIEGGRN
jgi:hypothetical protein